jgi:hypothetical protein
MIRVVYCPDHDLLAPCLTLLSEPALTSAPALEAKLRKDKPLAVAGRERRKRDTEHLAIVPEILARDRGGVADI